HVSGCFDIDCALYDGQHYVIFPPGPALLAMPFVALFGVQFAGFIAIATLLAIASLIFWRRIFQEMAVESATAIWLLIAIAFATPLYYVTLRGEGVWFLAQGCAFLLASAALYFVLV